MTRYQSTWRWRVLLAVLMLAGLALFAAVMTSCAGLGVGPQRVPESSKEGRKAGGAIDWMLPVEVIADANSDVR